jgi:hypothetical protein
MSIKRNPAIFSKKGTKTLIGSPTITLLDFNALVPIDNGSPVVGGLPNGRVFMDGKMRSDIQYNSYALTMETLLGRRMAKMRLTPTARSGQEFANDYRVEVTRNPWQGINRLPAGTERWHGYRIYFKNTGAEKNVKHLSEISLYQDHPGSVYSSGSNPPLQQIALAYPNQLRRHLGGGVYDPYFNTPLGGEIMLIQKNGNRDSSFRWSVPNMRVNPGVTQSLLIIMYTRVGEGNNGIWRVWLALDGDEATLAVHPSRPNQLGYTCYAAPNNFSGTTKFGTYHHGFKDPITVAQNVAAGHTHFTFYQDTMYELILSPDSPYYGRNWMPLVNPDNYYTLL